MLKSVQILHGVSRYEVFSVWEQALADGLRALGIAASVVSVHDERRNRDSAELGVGFNLVRQWSAPHNGNRHLCWLVDHPVYHALFFMPECCGLTLDRDACAVACVDRHWAEFGRELYGFPHMYFAPHFCVTTGFVSPGGGERPGGVVFFGSIEDPQSFLNSLERDAGPLWPALRERLEAYEALRRRPPLDVFLLAAFRKLTADPQQVRIMMNAFFPAADGYFRCRGRVRLLQSIVRTPVHVFGLGAWDRLAFGPNILFHGPIPFADVPAVMAGARVLLNHTPAHAHGAHERVFEALAAGCLVHSTTSEFLASAVGTEAGISFYDDVELSNVDDQLAALLADPTGPERVVAGQAIVARDHAARNRAQHLAEIHAERWSSSPPSVASP